jgi:acyl carrier protein
VGTVTIPAGTATSPPDLPTVREQVRRHCGFDPGPLDAAARLDELGLAGVALLRLVAGLEETYRVEFPSDLMTAVDTIDELVWFLGVKISQGPEGAGRDDDAG